MIDKVPTMVIVPQEASEMDAELRRDVRRLQAAYATLRGMKDYKCPIVLNEINTEEIDRITEERISRVSSDVNLLPSEVEERTKKYKTLHRNVVTQIHIVQKVVATWPEAQFAYEAEVQNIVPQADLESVVSAKCMREVPPIAQQHARLIDNALAAIAKLREFENAENVCKMRLEVLAHMDADTLAGHWANGSIHKPVFSNDTWGQRLSVGRRLAEQQYL